MAAPEGRPRRICEEECSSREQRSRMLLQRIICRAAYKPLLSGRTRTAKTARTRIVRLSTSLQSPCYKRVLGLWRQRGPP